MLSLQRRSFVYTFLSMACTAAISVNRTIDDEEGDPITGFKPEYSPPGLWNIGATCDHCTVRPNSSQTLNGTWHDTTFYPGSPGPQSITLRFKGTAIYVYNVLANTVPSTDTLTALEFTLDGTMVGTFYHVPTTLLAYEYNVSVYANETLPNVDHELVIQAAEVAYPVLILFDYAIYTFSDDLPPASASSSSVSSSMLVSELLSENEAHCVAEHPDELPSGILKDTAVWNYTGRKQGPNNTASHISHSSHRWWRHWWCCRPPLCHHSVFWPSKTHDTTSTPPPYVIRERLSG